MSKPRNQNNKRGPAGKYPGSSKRRTGSRLNPNSKYTSVSLAESSRVAFDTKGNFCASVVSGVAGFKIKVFDVVQNKLELEFAVPARTAIQAVAWCCIGEATDKKFQTLALCCDNGIILLYSIEDGQMVLKLVDGHNGPVTDFVASDNIGFSCSADGTIARWHLGTGKLINSWKANIGAIYRLSLMPSLKKLISGANAVKVWSTEDCRLLQDLPGHTNRVTCLTTSETLNVCLTAAHQDRFIAVSKLDESSSLSKPTCLSVDEEIHSLSISSLGSVIAVTESGSILIWESVQDSVSSSGDKPSPQEASATIRFVNPSKALIPVVQIKFSSSSKKTLVARGELWCLKFETMKFPDRFTSKEITYECIEPTQSENVTFKSSTSKITIKTGIASKGPSVALTLGEKLSQLQSELGTELGTPDSSPAIAASAKSLPELADSVAKVISQALHTKDYQLLNVTLTSAPSRSVVPTVECINPSQVYNLFQFFVDGIISRKSDVLVYSDWLRAIFAIHSSRLVSIPGISESLNQLMSSIDSRTKDIAPLSQLYHRLDLLSTESDSNNLAKSKGVPPAVYLEGSAVSAVDELIELNGTRKN